MKKAYSLHNLQSFLDIYFQGASVLLEEQDFYDLTWDYLSRINKENVQHVEVFFDPQLHTERGIPIDFVVKGIVKALQQGGRKWGITYEILPCFLRNLSAESALETFITLP